MHNHVKRSMTDMRHVHYTNLRSEYEVKKGKGEIHVGYETWKKYNYLIYVRKNNWSGRHRPNLPIKLLLNNDLISYISIYTAKYTVIKFCTT